MENENSLKLAEFPDIIVGFGLLGILSAMQSSEESISAQSNSDNKTLSDQSNLLYYRRLHFAVTQEYQFSIKVCYMIWRKYGKAEKMEFDLNRF